MCVCIYYCTCVNGPFFIKRIEKKERCERCGRYKERRKTRNRFYGCSIIQLDRRRTTHSCSEAQPSASSIKSCSPLTECKIEFYLATELFRVYIFLSSRKKEKKKEEKEIWLFRVVIAEFYIEYICKYGRKMEEKEKRRRREFGCDGSTGSMLTQHVCRDDGSWPRSWQR